MGDAGKASQEKLGEHLEYIDYPSTRDAVKGSRCRCRWVPQHLQGSLQSRARSSTAIPSFESVSRTLSLDPLDSSPKRSARTVDVGPYCCAQGIVLRTCWIRLPSRSATKANTLDVHDGLGDLGVGGQSYIRDLMRAVTQRRDRCWAFGLTR
jgi:hypothetical protein